MTAFPYADPGRPAFEKIDEYTNTYLLMGAFPEQKPCLSFPMPNSTTYPQFAVLGLDPITKKLAWATEGATDGVRATGLLTFSGAGSATETVTIGSRVYTLVTALTAANQVLIGGSTTATALNLIAAINGGAGAGTVYHASTVPHADVLARDNGAGLVGLVAHDAGIAANSIATTETSASASFGAATLTGGLNPTGVKAEFILAHATTTPATGTYKAPVWYSGYYNQDALVWHASFTTDAAKQAAFMSGRSNEIVIGKRA